jgi:hypothetical protein
LYVVEGLVLLVGKGLLEEPSPSCPKAAGEKIYKKYSSMCIFTRYIGRDFLYIGRDFFVHWEGFVVMISTRRVHWEVPSLL